MTTLSTFQSCIAWQKAHKLALAIYDLTKRFPREEQYRLVDQMCRAAISVPSNIAEGYKRQTVQDSLRFYNISQASLEELKYQLLLARDLAYISHEQYDAVFAIADETGKVLHGWINAQRKT